MKTSSTSPILFHEVAGPTGSLGVITLNTPHNYQATRLAMTRLLYQQLQTWKHATHIQAIAIYSPLEKAFCVGGDLRALYEGDRRYAEETFCDEYRLIAALAHYPKPTIAFTQGYTMGGGVGLSIHMQYRIAAPTIQWAMPETRIGFFPDVSASYFLPAVPKHIGRYLGLTGTILGARDAQHCGFIDYIVPFIAFPTLLERIAHSDYQHKTMDKLIRDYTQTTEPSNLSTQADHIATHFHFASMQDISRSLQTDASEWAQRTRTQLAKRSPLSLCITAELLQPQYPLSLHRALAREYQLACYLYEKGDFIEGIRAQIIDKDKAPRWQHETLDEVSQEQIAEAFDTTRPMLTFGELDSFTTTQQAPQGY
jgi:enoyl-CoA hydratase